MVWDHFKEEAIIYVSLFAFFTLLAFIARGKDAFNWTPQLRHSAFVNFGFIAFNTVMGVFLFQVTKGVNWLYNFCLLYTSPSPRDATLSRMPSSA